MRIGSLIYKYFQLKLDSKIFFFPLTRNLFIEILIDFSMYTCIHDLRPDSYREKMWKLKVGEGGPWLTTEHNHLGRQHWEFNPDAGTPEERAHVDRLRQEFSKNRFRNKQMR